MIEVESKFRIKNRAEVEVKLGNLAYSKADPVEQSDKVFLLNSDSFKTFKVGDPVTRIRVVNGVSSLTYKAAINAHGDSVEHEMTVDPPSAAEGLLLEMGYKPVTHVDKIRTEYKQSDVTVVIDEVRGLGNFVEVEIVCEEGQSDSARTRIMAVASELGLDESDIETKKYDQLMSELK